MTTTPACARARQWLLDEQRDRLDEQTARELRTHVSGCASCRAFEQAESELTELLHTKLVQPPAPRALRQRLLAEYTPKPARAEAPRSAWWNLRSVGATLASALLLMAACLVWLRPNTTSQVVVREALNDHLRVIYAQNPIEIASGGIHQVKPWFTGRLDFAPDISFSGDDDFPLIGGAVGYFVDRKAAMLVFKRRLHTISCVVFRAEGLPWPRGNERTLEGGVRVHVAALDGFHVVLWRDADLGHALVSDLSERELLQLVTKLAPTH